MSQVTAAQRKLLMAQALERQAVKSLISAARLESMQKDTGCSTCGSDYLEGGKRRRRKTATKKTTAKKSATKKTSTRRKTTRKRK